jgi:hypothetical protein
MDLKKIELNAIKPQRRKEEEKRIEKKEDSNVYNSPLGDLGNVQC